MKKRILMYIGLFVIVAMFLTAVFAPALAPFNPREISLPDRFMSPSFTHWFGSDNDGTDVLSKVIFGARISIYVAFTVVAISLFIGLCIGSIAGYFGGKIDQTIMRFIDMLYAFPGFLLAIALVAVLGPSIQNLILAMCVTGWTGYARLVRGEFLHLKTREYVQSAISLGANPLRVIAVHIWPNLTGPLVVQASFGMAGTIIAESSLSFLGLGTPPTEPSWGGLLNAGRKFLVEAPYISIFPGLAIILLVLGFNLFGDGLRDYLDPKKN